jgi:hypothetical protein
MTKRVMERLTWTDSSGSTEVVEGDEDYIDSLVGQLRDSYWDPKTGWTIDWKIDKVKAK